MADPTSIPATERQAAFAKLYLSNGRNGTAAAIGAGVPEGSAPAQASKWLRNPKVRAIIDEADGRATKKAGITVERVVKELRDVLVADVSEAFDEHGCMKPVREWPKHLRRAISAIETDVVVNPTTGEARIVPKKVRFWSKTDAADKLMKHLGGYAPERHDVTVTGLAESLRDARARAGGDK